jgi:hypothetical protein
MIDIAADLRDRFEGAIICFYEQSEVMSDGESDPDLSDDDAKAVIIEGASCHGRRHPARADRSIGNTAGNRAAFIREYVGSRCASCRLRICPR